MYNLDLIGKQFGNWIVLDYAGNNKWLCECQCKNKTVREVVEKSLKSGRSTSCGKCLTPNFKPGDMVGNWLLLNKIKGTNKWLCECQCKDKTQREVNQYDLDKGKSTNCGCVRKMKISARNSAGRYKLEGTIINEWNVLKYIGDKHYFCQCSCGRFKCVASYDLTKGISKSCGHNNGKNLIKDITNQRFGELIVKRYLGHKYWECECSCENHTIVKVLKGNLLNGSVQSCGCKQYSRISKDQIIAFINEYNTINNELPFVKDIADFFDKNEGHMRRYIKEYELDNYINRSYDSKAERELFRIFNGAILHNRTLLDGKEIDIYIPEKKLAIEFNGTYWHSDIYKDKKYHQQKTINLAKRGIRLIHIFEYEWNNPDIKSKIQKFLGIVSGNISIKKIGARKTIIKNISNDIAKEFCNKWHLQNGINSEINIGCYYNDELIGVMTFGKPRFDSIHEYELLRLCWKENYSITGGAEKIFNYFIQKYNPTSIITYCDISKFTGNVYTKLGFKPIYPNPFTEPNYVWIDTLNNNLLTRYQTQKHKLLELGLGSENQSEDDIMKSVGYFKVYDSGNLKLEWLKGEQ